MTDKATVLQLSDAKKRVDEIAASEGVTPGRVYAILRKLRPGRERSPRKRTSLVPGKVIALLNEKHKPSRVALMLHITPAYVYRIMKEHPDELTVKATE